MNWDVLPRVGPRDFDPEMIAAWIRPSGAIYDAGFLGGESHPTSARHLTGLDDDVLAVYDVLRSGAMRFTSYELEAGATFVVDPTPEQIGAIRALIRASGATHFVWNRVALDANASRSSRFVYPESGDDLESLVERAVRSNPSLWQRIPEDLDARIRAYNVRRDETDDFYYHVTTATNARGILATGLRPGRGRSSMADGFFRAYSRGNVFLTELGGVRFWLDRIEEHLECQGRWSPTSKLVVLRILKSDAGDVEHDEFGSSDARAGAKKAAREIGRVTRRAR